MESIPQSWRYLALFACIAIALTDLMAGDSTTARYLGGGQKRGFKMLAQIIQKTAATSIDRVWLMHRLCISRFANYHAIVQFGHLEV